MDAVNKEIENNTNSISNIHSIVHYQGMKVGSVIAERRYLERSLKAEILKELDRDTDKRLTSAIVSNLFQRGLLADQRDYSENSTKKMKEYLTTRNIENRRESSEYEQPSVSVN